MKTVYILIGPRGSGKTYLGKILEKNFGIKFLSVEEFFLKHTQAISFTSESEFASADEAFAHVWEGIRQEIDVLLLTRESVALESLGLYDSFKVFLNDIKKSYQVKLIQVVASPEACIARLRERDVATHVPMSEAVLREVNAKVVQEQYIFDAVIDNNHASEEELTVRLQSAL